MINIVFQNENFVICDKSASVLSVPAREANDSRPCLGLELQKQLKMQIFPVHRLDYEVSGLVIYALNSNSHKESQKWFLKRQISKKYSALTLTQDFKHWPLSIPTERDYVEVKPDSTFLWKTQILRGKKRSYESTHGEWAETKAQIQSVSENELNWTLFPMTGKPHQLRLELSRRGFPILGDELYGSKVKFALPGIALRALEIDLKNVKERLGLPQSLSVKTWEL